MRTERPGLPPSLSAWWVAIAGAIRLVVFYVIIPLALSFLGTRQGWSGSIPSPSNFLALAIIGGGVLLLLWCISVHVTRFSNSSSSDSYPPFLLADGPYRFSRNPMYLADIAIWFGWSLFYGSMAVLIATLCFASLLAFVSIPSEERSLLARFGDEYLVYQKSVRRWVGRRD